MGFQPRVSDPVAAIAEPTIALAIFSLALGAGSTNLSQIVSATLTQPGSALSPGHLLAFAALFQSSHLA